MYRFISLNRDHRACYEDGNLVPAKVGQTAEPKPCAGNDGTLITVEDLFHNTPTRLSALRSSTEEYARILDVMTKYAVHNYNVSFICKKVGPHLYITLVPTAFIFDFRQTPRPLIYLHRVLHLSRKQSACFMALVLARHYYK